METHIVTHAQAEVTGTLSWAVAAARDVADDFDVPSEDEEVDRAQALELRANHSAAASQPGVLSELEASKPLDETKL